ncbi:MAG TPA: class I SAM-dependent methyltransferase [Lysobacter sp.]|nr:class I SAM-dependent methyltransferase [Lysobacter sp.]
MRPGAPSATALLVASSVVRAGAAHGLPSAAIRIAEHAVGAARGSWLALARYRPGRWLMAAAERVVLPGLAAHHCARKAWLWRRLQRPSVIDGAVAWAGVGFDGLGRALLEQAPHATIVETDHPDTLRLRRMWLGEAGVRMQALALPADIDALAALCAARPATVVCEGVLMYLPPRDVVRMLRRLVAQARPPRLVFSILDTADGHGVGFPRLPALARHWLDCHGEPFRWRASPEQVRRCLARAGYVVTAHWNGRALGEYMVEAEWVRVECSAAQRSCGSKRAAVVVFSSTHRESRAIKSPAGRGGRRG